MNPATDLATLTEGYRLCCAAEGKSPMTIRWYCGKLSVFRQYLEASGLPTEIGAVEVGHIRKFLVHLSSARADQNNPKKRPREEALSSLTIQGYVRTFKAFYSWLMREGYVTKNPMKLIRVPKAAKIIIETFSDEQIRSLLASIDTKDALGYRDYCVLLVLLDTGMRLSELAGLRLPDVHLEQGEFKVCGKGQKERIVPMGGNVQRVLWKYLHSYRPEPALPMLDYLFLDRTGEPMKPDCIYRMIKRSGHRAGLRGVRCSPHTFRHTFAKNYLLNGGDVFSLQKILGHSSLEVVKLYVNLAAADVHSQHRKFSPVDMMRLRA